MCTMFLVVTVLTRKFCRLRPTFFRALWVACNVNGECRSTFWKQYVHVIMLVCCLIGGNGDSVKTLETLHQRVKRQENLLQRCKEVIRSHKERCAQLTNEKEALQEQLEERLQELEKMKVWKMLLTLWVATKTEQELQYFQNLLIRKTLKQIAQRKVRNLTV